MEVRVVNHVRLRLLNQFVSKIRQNEVMVETRLVHDPVCLMQISEVLQGFEITLELNVFAMKI